MRTMITRFRATVILGALVMAMVGLQAAPASGANGAFLVAFEGDAQLGEFPDDDNSHTGDFHGWAVGAGAGVAPTLTDTATAVRANGDAHNLHAHGFDYTELSEACPVVGTANGSFDLELDSGNVASGDFDWVRLGATAVITVTDVNGGGFSNGLGAGAAAFDAEPAALECDGDPVSALVVGAAVIVDQDVA